MTLPFYQILEELIVAIKSAGCNMDYSLYTTKPHTIPSLAAGGNSVLSTFNWQSAWHPPKNLHRR